MEPNNSLCVDGVRKTSMKISEVGERRQRLDFVVCVLCDAFSFFFNRCFTYSLSAFVGGDCTVSQIAHGGTLATTNLSIESDHKRSGVQLRHPFFGAWRVNVREPRANVVLCFCFDDLQSSGQADSERAAHAMADPEIQAILTDPMVRQVLTDFKENPQHAQKVHAHHVCNPSHRLSCS